jgi:hypothetical protein
LDVIMSEEDEHRQRAQQEDVAAAKATDISARIAHERLSARHRDEAAKPPVVEPASRCAAALKRDEVDASNLDQTRNAGLDSIRDSRGMPDWDGVDDTSDASFPSSDPPSQTRQP